MTLPAFGVTVVIITTPFAAREPYIAVAAASFKIVMLAIRLGSISYNFCTLISKPSMIKVGRLGLFFNDVLERLCASNCVVPIPERPRIYNSGTLFGFEPAKLFSAIRKEGSNVCKAPNTFVLETDIN